MDKKKDADQKNAPAANWRKCLANGRSGTLPSAGIRTIGDNRAARCLPETASGAAAEAVETTSELPTPSPEQASMTQHRRNLALLEAAEKSDNSGILSWLGAGADPNCQMRAWPGDTPLLWCSRLANHDGVRALLSHGADPSVSNQSKETPLLISMNKGSFKVSSTIISSVASGLSKGESDAFFDEAFVMACRQQDFDSAKLLMPKETERALSPSLILAFVNCFCGSGSRKESLPDRSHCLDVVLERQPDSADRAETVDLAFSSAFDQDDGELFKNLLRRGFAPSTGWSDEKGTPLVWGAGTRNFGGTVFAAMMSIDEFSAAFKSHVPAPQSMSKLSYKHISKLQSMGGLVTEGRGPSGENIMHVILTRNSHSFVDLKAELTETVKTWPVLARTTDSDGKSPFDRMRATLGSNTNYSFREHHLKAAFGVVDHLEQLAARLEAETLLAFSKKVVREAAKSGVKKQMKHSVAASV